MAIDSKLARDVQDLSVAELAVRFGLSGAEAETVAAVRIDGAKPAPRRLEERLSRSGLIFGGELAMADLHLAGGGDDAGLDSNSGEEKSSDDGSDSRDSDSDSGSGGSRFSDSDSSDSDSSDSDSGSDESKKNTNSDTKGDGADGEESSQDEPATPRPRTETLRYFDIDPPESAPEPDPEDSSDSAARPDPSVLSRHIDGIEFEPAAPDRDSAAQPDAEPQPGSAPSPSPASEPQLSGQPTDPATDVPTDPSGPTTVEPRPTDAEASSRPDDGRASSDSDDAPADPVERAEEEPARAVSDEKSPERSAGSSPLRYLAVDPDLLTATDQPEPAEQPTMPDVAPTRIAAAAEAHVVGPVVDPGAVAAPRVVDLQAMRVVETTSSQMPRPTVETTGPDAQQASGRPVSAAISRAAELNPQPLPLHGTGDGTDAGIIVAFQNVASAKESAAMDPAFSSFVTGHVPADIESVALNPQPLPPHPDPTTIAHLAELNPQPLPPQGAGDGAEAGIIIIGGREEVPPNPVEPVDPVSYVGLEKVALNPQPLPPQLDPDMSEPVPNLEASGPSPAHIDPSVLKRAPDMSPESPIPTGVRQGSMSQDDLKQLLATQNRTFGLLNNIMEASNRAASDLVGKLDAPQGGQTHGPAPGEPEPEPTRGAAEQAEDGSDGAESSSVLRHIDRFEFAPATLDPESVPRSDPEAVDNPPGADSSIEFGGYTGPDTTTKLN